ncbi:alanine dehydrogenase [bacterium SCSIO 12741]|nr:alanine dehydrogenase [bacterium SCSIO 12741]
MDQLKIGIIREGKTPPDERVPLAPEQVAAMMKEYPQVEWVVESSPIRRFKDEEYANLGVSVVTDLSDCDVLMGVKEVPKDQLIPGKTYFFFSHTIKKQPYNRDLLRKIMADKIRLIDYECLTNDKGRRLIGFGRYAGIVGAYNGLLAYGKRHGLYDLKPAWKCEDRAEMEGELAKVKFDPANPPKMVLTGNGRVAHGAMEILSALSIKKVSADDFLTQSYDEAVYCQLRVTDYNKRKDGGEGSTAEFFEHPDLYTDDFMRFAQVSDLYFACHFWKDGSPYLFTREQAKSSDFKIEVVADISCDIDGPVASTLRPSTIADPLYGYLAESETETDWNNPAGITVMAVDNLPCELPKDASRDFGQEFIQNILPALLGDDPTSIIDRATITQDGELTSYYSYLADYVA